MSKKNTKRALLSSVLALVLCFAMLTGTTFAWFTDSVTSGKNQIVAGNLDVELYHNNAANKTDTKVTEETEDLFNVTLWEPGVVTYENFTVKNEGSLALYYELGLNLGAFNTLNGHDLSEVLKVLVLDEHFTGDRDAAIAKFQDDPAAVTDLKSITASGKLYPDATASEHKFSVIIYWEPSASDNNFNVNNGQQTSNGEPLFLELGIALFATQLTHEKDSFGPDYDATASVTVATIDELNAAVAAGNAALLTGNAFENVTLDLTKNANIVLTHASLGGTLNIPEGVTVNLYAGSANALTVTGKGTLVLNGVNINAGAGQNALTVDGDVAIVINSVNNLVGGKGADGIHVTAGHTLDLSGAGSLAVTGNNGLEYFVYGGKVIDTYTNTDDASYASHGGNGIGGQGAIYIHDLAKLSAMGYGVSGFGIGGASESITIKNTYISYARGGFANDIAIVGQVKYAKNDPNGGAAIGNGVNGTVITLDNVKISKAEGGSKAAGIGASFWNSTEIVITNCDIVAVGGVSSAAVGGSRIRQDDPSTQTTKITIVDSKVTAFGGYFGAGIGSGYDTHCADGDVAPVCTINISGNSVITAKGGKYAAGVGTGYHAGGLAGTIESSVTLNAQSGEKWYKDAYSLAQDVGFGVIDPTRDGKNNPGYLTVGGTTITVADALATVKN